MWPSLICMYTISVAFGMRKDTMQNVYCLGCKDDFYIMSHNSVMIINV